MLGKLQVALVLIPVRFRLCIRGVRGGERSLGTGESVGVHHSALKGTNSIRKDDLPTCAAEKRRLGHQGAGSTGSTQITKTMLTVPFLKRKSKVDP